MLFSGGQTSVYRRVPRTVRSLSDFRLTDVQWEGLLVPINLAFFYRTSQPDRVPGSRVNSKIIAVYPSPAGPVESLLDLDAWEAIVEDNPVLADMQPEVEALLVHRLAGKHRYYLLPIDQCYRLSGLIRLRWRGLSGGSEVWEEVGRFFNELEEQSCST